MTVGELITDLSHRDPGQALAISSVEELFIVKQEAKLGVENPGPVLSNRDQILREKAELMGVDTPSLKEGLLVCLKTGGPLMMVEDTRSEVDVLSTVWFVDGKCYRDAFHRDSLNIFVQVV